LTQAVPTNAICSAQRPGIAQFHSKYLEILKRMQFTAPQMVDDVFVLDRVFSIKKIKQPDLHRAETVPRIEPRFIKLGAIIRQAKTESPLQ
jgi:hypothetical protein